LLDAKRPLVDLDSSKAGESGLFGVGRILDVNRAHGTRAIAFWMGARHPANEVKAFQRVADVVELRARDD
jgi:hypothetical protein